MPKVSYSRTKVAALTRDGSRLRPTVVMSVFGSALLLRLPSASSNVTSNVSSEKS